MSTKKLTEFSQRLKSVREQAGLSKAELARQAKISAAYIGQLESMTQDAQKNPSAVLVERLSQVLNVNSVWLKTGEGEMFQGESQQPYETRQEQTAEEAAMGNIIAEAQRGFETGSLKLSFFEEALFFMMQDMSDEARRRVQKDIIMEWIAEKRKN